MGIIKHLASEHAEEIISIIEKRFAKNINRHRDIEWDELKARLEACMSSGSADLEKLWSLNEMERTGGEPDVIAFDNNTGEYIFCDCSAESPKGRRSLCYDREGLESRKEYKPVNTAVDMADAMGIELLNEEQYRELQKLGKFDSKTSSWLKTPSDIRKLGGAIFADYRYGCVFIYHNSAPSYYASRGFRGILKI